MRIVAIIRLRKEITGDFWLALSGIASVVFAFLVVMNPAAGALTMRRRAGVEKQAATEVWDWSKWEVHPSRQELENNSERERLLREWTQCGRRLAKLLDDQLAAMKSSVSCWLGRQKPKPNPKYFGHMNLHGCV